ncbi:hypothetical protein BG011_000336 [Mortierella polycephala]|uniref:Histone deacetylase complex subunit SAP30 Sin3 binding domain-containing protein n=1 Tax=Mortierella polycephala TaxID=41804 RepID=A0A9P6TVE2_9FUNG|nr:hypothetical protein BG011_000336 [Mortierella polycephala]
MAPKLKSTDTGPTSSGNKASYNSSGNNNNNNANNSSGGGHHYLSSHDRQGHSERGHSNAANTASERGSGHGGSGGSGGGHDRSSYGSGDRAHGGEKTLSSNAGSKRKAEAQLVTVDFDTMDIAALRRYCRLNKLKPKSKSREDLAAIATRHWSGVPVKEVDSVAYFLFAVKHRHNVLKLTMPLS